MNVVIMAGGGGTRLWPLSRNDKPKQFIDLGTGKTLLEHTYSRALAVAGPDNIFVATTEDLAGKVKEMLPDLPADNVLPEPARKDTGPAIARACRTLQEKGAGAEPVIFMWADHYFTAEDVFIADLKKIPALVQENPEQIIIIGHKPTSAETGLGYIQLGEEKAENLFAVAAFKEKPDLETAEKYLTDGKHVWNMAYISSTPDYIVDQLQEHEPEIVSDKQYEDMKQVSIDVALLEKTTHILALVNDYGWTDVGNWAAVKDVFGQAGDHVPNGSHVHVDSQNNYIYNATDKTVSMLGMKDTIAVVTDDAILITSKADAPRVKEVIQCLEEDGNTKCL